MWTGHSRGCGPQDAWSDLGPLAEEPASSKRKAARYRVHETVVTIDRLMYRAVVIHSDAHDKRRLRKLAKELEKNKVQLVEVKRDVEKITFACLPDAQAAERQVTNATPKSTQLSPRQCTEYGLEIDP